MVNILYPHVKNVMPAVNIELLRNICGNVHYVILIEAQKQIGFRQKHIVFYFLTQK